MLVCGGRTYDDAFAVKRYLEAQIVSVVIQGGATGADALAKKWAEDNGIPCIEVRANWKYYGAAAGPIRNDWMLRYCSFDMVLAFPGGTGTANMVRLARASGIEVVEVPDRNVDAVLVAQITADHFTAGIVLRRDRVVECADIVRYMKGWSRDKVRDYCREKGWRVGTVKG